MRRLLVPYGAPPLVDVAAACCAALAAAAAHWLTGRLLRPFHPSALVAPREGSGLLSFLGQNGYDIFVNEGLAASYRALHASGFRAVCMRVFYFHRMLVGHPQDLEHIMVHHASNYVKGADYNVLKVTLGDGLVTLLDDATHSAHRRAISPAFAPTALKEIADTCMRLHALEMLKSVRSSMQQHDAAASGSQRPLR
jgi:cytochrome P450